jgi:hypothetical protein
MRWPARDRLFPHRHRGKHFFLEIHSVCRYHAFSLNHSIAQTPVSKGTKYMGKVFRPSTRESSILSKIESTKEHKRRLAISSLRDCLEPLSNSIAMKLVENSLVETTNKNSLEEQVRSCLEKLTRASDFDIDYQIAPVRNLVPDFNIVSIYVTAFIIEKLLEHKDIIDIFGSDEEIYLTVNQQVKKHLPV